MWLYRLENESIEEAGKMLPHKIHFRPKKWPVSPLSVDPYIEPDAWCEENCSGLFLLAEHEAAFEKQEDLASFILRWL